MTARAAPRSDARDAASSLQISVLGPLGLVVDGQAVEVPGVKRRATLALLARAGPSGISTDRLVDALWPDEPPATGRAALQSHVSRLRRHLGPAATRLASRDAGYRLELARDELDATVLTDLIRDARATTDDDPAAAARWLTEARAHWRGSPLNDLRDIEPLASWARALTEAWLDACDLLARCALAVSDPTTAMTVAADALAEEPLREASTLILVEALAAQGRAADGLRIAHQFRRRLLDETGLDASPALAAVEHAVAAGSATSTHPSRVRAAQPSLPAPDGPLLGRDAELAGLIRLVATERLVTVIGPAGVGKTRLALEVAHRASASSDVTLLSLAAVTNGDALPDVLARALGLETGRGDVVERCTTRLADGPHLLVVDNCEHLLEPVRALVSALLPRCPHLTVLATSRERLANGSEQTCRLAPLALPADSAHSGTVSVPSVALFLDRARRVRPDFEPSLTELDTIARVVRKLDGIPLAIELAAGRLSALGIDDLEARLDRALDLLGGRGDGGASADDRHRTLRTAIDWSYDLLPNDEQALFRNLAVFPGGFDLATAENVARDLPVRTDPTTVLAHLVDTSMVVAELDARPRYRMLDTLRAFGLDRLAAAGELDTATDRLLQWAMKLAEQLDAAYDTDHEPDADARLRLELANIRTAWHTARAQGDLDVAASLVVHLYSLVAWRDLTEQWRWFLEIADDPALHGHPREAAVLGVASEAVWSSTGDLDRAESLARRAIADGTASDERGRAFGTWALASVLLFRGHFDEAGELAVRAREGVIWEAEGYAQAALAATYAGDLVGARRRLDQAHRVVGGPTLRAYLRYIEAEMQNAEGDWAAARTAYRDAIDSALATGATFIEGIASVGLVTVEAADGNVMEALQGFRDLITRWERTGAWTQQWTTLRNLADLLERMGDAQTAAALRNAADASPEASAVDGPVRQTGAGTRGAGLARDEAVALAREAITRTLGRAATP